MTIEFDGQNNKLGTTTANSVTIKTNDTDALIVDSSQNVLVGQTATTVPGVGNTTAGMSFRGENGAFISRTTASNVATLTLNRDASDGVLQIFNRGGTEIGRIGVDSTDNLFISGNSTHAGMQFGTATIVPFKNGSLVDNQIDLGNEIRRWNDLYLGGNIYLGGTGSANALDDYEEGSWTPTVIQTVSNPTISYNRQMGHYTKIGRLVIVTGNIYSTSVTNGSGNVRISNLPFIFNAQDNGMEGGISIGYVNGFTSTNSPQAGLPSRGNSFITLITNDGSDGRNNLDVAVTNTGTLIDINFSIVYITTN